jgi:ATP-dependent RNA helicase DDX10/DBP4
VEIKNLFDLHRLPLEEFSASLGLPGAPTVKFLKGEDVKKLKNAPRQNFTSSEDEADQANGLPQVKRGTSGRTKWDRIKERVNQDVLSSHQRKLIRDTHDEDTEHLEDSLGDDPGGDGFLSVKRIIRSDDNTVAGLREHDNEKENDSAMRMVHLPGAKDAFVIDSRRREKVLGSKKKLLKFKDKGSKLVFDDEGNARQIYELEDEAQFRLKGEPEVQRSEFLEQEKRRVAVADVDDLELAKAKKRQRKERRKEREKQERDYGGTTPDRGTVLAPLEESYDYGGAENSRYSGSDIESSKVGGDDDTPDGVHLRDQRHAREFMKHHSLENLSDGKHIVPKGISSLEDLETIVSGLLK